MATEKTFSRINAGKSMLFLGRFIPAKSFPAQSPKLVCQVNQQYLLVQLLVRRGWCLPGSEAAG